MTTYSPGAGTSADHVLPVTVPYVMNAPPECMFCTMTLASASGAALVVFGLPSGNWEPVKMRPPIVAIAACASTVPAAEAFEKATLMIRIPIATRTWRILRVVRFVFTVFSFHMPDLNSRKAA
jgi:hypothetical protein